MWTMPVFVVLLNLVW